MPTYDYECDACGHKFELFQGINDKKQRKCPKCGKLKLRRLIGAGAAIMFKGSGFYKTDYRSEAYKSKAAADKPASTESSSSDGKKSEAKSSDANTSTPKSEPKSEKKKKPS